MPKTMKRELTAFLEFVLIAVFVGYGYFAALLFQQLTALSLWDEYEQLLTKWIISFAVLSVIRLAVVYYFTSRKKFYDSAQPTLKGLIEREFSETIQYVIIAGISGLIAFCIEISSHFAPDISINIEEAWLNFERIFIVWMLGFLLLSLLRAGIIYIKNKPFQDKYIAEN